MSHERVLLNYEDVVYEIRNMSPKDISALFPHVKLRKASGNYWRAFYLFHAEKTPSLVFSERHRCFYCFGCGENGDAISLFAKIHKIPYTQAMIRIAKYFHIPLTWGKPSETSSVMNTSGEMCYKNTDVPF